jgi:O-antigen/teichoic acid export membrane protein
MFGSGVSQLIPLIASLILGRLYTSEEFGVFTLFSSVVSFLTVASTLRYELAIMLPKKNIDAFHLLLLASGISFIVSAIILVLTIVIPIQISGFLSSENIKPWLIFMGISVFLISNIQNLTIWLNRRKNYKNISTNMIGQSATSASVNIANGFAGFTSGGLIPGSLAGQGVGFILFFRLLLKRDKRLFKHISWKRVKQNAVKYNEYPKFNFPHRLVDMISVTGLPILIATLFSEAVLGSYGFMLRVLKAPLGILSASLGQVYYQQISEEVAKNKSVISLFKKTVTRVALIISPFFLLILIWGPDIFALVFSEKWRIAGTYAQYLTPWLFITSITSPVSQTPLTMGYVKLNMWAGVFSNLLLVGLFYLFANLYNDAETVFKLLGLILPAFYLLLLYWYYYIIKQYENKLQANL